MSDAGVTGSTCQCSMQAPAPPVLDSEPCKHQDLTMTCSHGRVAGSKQPGGIIVNESVSTSGLAATPYLEVIAGPVKKGDDVTIETSILEGPCYSHQDVIMDWQSKPLVPSDEKSKSNETLVLAVHSNPIDWDNLIGYFWLPWVPKRKYVVNASSCTGVSTVGEIVAIPDISWDVSIKVGFDSAAFWVNQLDRDEDVVVYNQDQGTSVFTFEPNVKWKYDGDQKNLGTKIQKTLKKAMGPLDYLAQIIERVNNLLYDLSGTQIDVKHQTEVTGSWQWKEIPGKCTCGLKCDLKLSLDPLLEVTVTQNITAAILALLAKVPQTAPVGIPLQKAYSAMEQRKQNFNAVDSERDQKRFHFDGFFTGAITLAVKGGVGLVVEYKKEAAAEKWQTSGHGKGNVSVTIKASIEGKIEGRVWSFKTSASAVLSISATSGFKVDQVVPETRGNETYLGFVFIFTGVEVDGLGKADLDTGFVSKEDPDKPTPEPKPVQTFGGGETEQEKPSTANGDQASTENSGSIGLGTITGKEKTTHKKTNDDGYEYTDFESEASVDLEVGESSLKVEGSKSFKAVLVEPVVLNFTGKKYGPAPKATVKQPIRIWKKAKK